jgi:predicted amidohydrolase YtcJ
MRKHLAVLGMVGTFLLQPLVAKAETLTADTILTGGKIVTVDAKGTIAEAIAIRNGKILAVGTAGDVKTLSGPHTKTISLGGRTVIPGLIDSHIHAIRAGLAYASTLDWSGIKNIKEALETIHEAAHDSPPGSWIMVLGGWNKDQLAERRAPTAKELQQAAPDHPVYVQHLYNFAVLSPLAMNVLKITAESKLPPNGKVELDSSGMPTGVITAGGSVPTLARIVGRLPKPTRKDQIAGTRKFFRALNQSAVTGIIDEVGGGLTAQLYRPLFDVWRNGQLTVRVRFDIMSQKRGHEVSETESKMRMIPPRWGDEWLRNLGIGESPIRGMHDGSVNAVKPFTPKPEAKQALLDLATWAAANGYTMHLHASRNSSAEAILDIFEQVNKVHPITNLRWAIVHIEDATDSTLSRMKALGMGYAVQDRLYFGGNDYIKAHGKQVARRAPPIMAAIHAGLVVGAGTDSIAVSPYNAFISLHWLLTGKTLTGQLTRGPDQLPSRLEALKMYTWNSAWLSFDENERGSLERGKLADLAVLDRDYLTVPVDDIPKIQSQLTMVGGGIVYAAGSFAADEQH